MSFICYFDLLGVGELAVNDPDKYAECLEAFRDSIAQSCYALSGVGKAFVFSDCAYVETKQLPELLTFLGVLRKALFVRRTYLRGAIGVGELGQKSAIDTQRLSPKLATERTATVQGSSFGVDVVPVYRMESTLKGIGLRIMPKETPDEHRVTSCYLPSSKSRKAECFTDLKIQPSDISSVFVKDVLDDMYMTTMRTPAVGKYYIPLLTTMVQSLHLHTPADSLDWDSVDPSKLLKFLFSGRFSATFSNVPGIEYVYYAALNRVCNDLRSYPDIVSLATKFICNSSKLLKCFTSIPSELFGESNKKDFLRSLSERKIIIE